MLEEDYFLDGFYGKYDFCVGVYGDDDIGGGLYDLEIGLCDWYVFILVEV